MRNPSKRKLFPKLPVRVPSHKPQKSWAKMGLPPQNYIGLLKDTLVYLWLRNGLEFWYYLAYYKNGKCFGFRWQSGDFQWFVVDRAMIVSCY